jgi:hypothetical protein
MFLLTPLPFNFRGRLVILLKSIFAVLLHVNPLRPPIFV